MEASPEPRSRYPRPGSALHPTPLSCLLPGGSLRPHLPPDGPALSSPHPSAGAPAACPAGRPGLRG